MWIFFGPTSGLPPLPPFWLRPLRLLPPCAPLLPPWGKSQSDSGVVYKEETVSRGDLTVGVTESGTASLETFVVSYPVLVEVEEVYVKAGQRVTSGEALLKVDLDSLQDEYSTLEDAYNSAVLKLEEAQLNQTTGLLDAKLDYDSTVLGGDTAELQYDYSISEIYAELTNA